jgi:hypothetical protein
MGIMIQKKTTGMPNENRNEQRKKPSRIDYDPPKKTLECRIETCTELLNEK